MNKKNNQKFLGYGNNRKYTEKQFLFTTCSKLAFFGEYNEQSLVILWVN